MARKQPNARVLKNRAAVAVARPVVAAPDPRRLTERLSSAERKTYPMAEGLMDYFPDALAVVANVSWVGNAKHNGPGTPLHHSRGKSMDHADCCARHLLERGGFDVVVIEGVEHRIRHTAALAWRALALLQEELEGEMGLPLPRNAYFDDEPAAAHLVRPTKT